MTILLLAFWFPSSIGELWSHYIDKTFGWRILFLFWSVPDDENKQMGRDLYKTHKAKEKNISRWHIRALWWKGTPSEAVNFCRKCFPLVDFFPLARATHISVIICLIVIRIKISFSQFFFTRSYTYLYFSCWWSSVHSAWSVFRYYY